MGFWNKSSHLSKHRSAIVSVCSGTLCKQISSKDTLKPFTATLRSTFKCMCVGVGVSVAVLAGEQKGLGHKSHTIHHALALREGWKRGSAGRMACLGPHLPPETWRLTPVCVVLPIVCGCVRGKKSVWGCTGWEVQLIKKD